jgi:alpha-ribazole phosphatase
VRHGATDWNVELRAQGQADIALNDLGRRQARNAALRLAPVDVDAVYASDLRRAFDTAREIASCHGLDVVAEPALREIDQGEWTGLTDEEIRSRWPERWGQARHYNARPGGEAPGDVRRRALGALARIVSKHPDATVVVVSHGATIRTIVAEVLGYDIRSSAALRGLANGGIVSFEAEMGDGRLVFARFERLDGRTPAREDPNQ